MDTPNNDSDDTNTSNKPLLRWTTYYFLVELHNFWIPGKIARLQSHRRRRDIRTQLITERSFSEIHRLSDDFADSIPLSSELLLFEICHDTVYYLFGFLGGHIRISVDLLFQFL